MAKTQEQFFVFAQGGAIWQKRRSSFLFLHREVLYGKNAGAVFVFAQGGAIWQKRTNKRTYVGRITQEQLSRSSFLIYFREEGIPICHGAFLHIHVTTAYTTSMLKTAIDL